MSKIEIFFHWQKGGSISLKAVGGGLWVMLCLILPVIVYLVLKEYMP